MTTEEGVRLGILVFQPLILVFLVRLLRAIDRLTEAVRLQNGRLLTQEEWRRGHEVEAARKWTEIQSDVYDLQHPPFGRSKK